MKDAREFTNYKNTLARHNMIMLATVGSTILGLAQEEKSDIDEMGICIEQPKQLLGFAPFENDIYRTAHDRTGNFNAKSEPGDIDLTIYGLRKYVRLALGGNPNVIALLYLPQKKFSAYTPLAAELQELSPAFASKQISKAFLGYLQAQRLRLQGSRGGMDVNRQDLVEQFGFDTKYAMHMMRLAFQGHEFMRRGKLSFPLAGEEVKLLQRMRTGGMSLEEGIKVTLNYEAEIKYSVEVDGNMPDKPDYDKVEQWLLDVYKREWYENKETSQQQGVTADTPRENSRASKTDGEKIKCEIPF